MFLSNKISLLFTKSITNVSLCFSIAEIVLPILCKYAGLLSVFVAKITPDISFKCTPSSIMPTQYITFKCSELSFSKSFKILLFILEFIILFSPFSSYPYVETLDIVGSLSIFSNHSFAFDFLSSISFISLQNTIYFPSSSVICSSISSGIPGAFSDFSTNSSYFCFNSVFLSSSAFSIFSNKVCNSSSFKKSGTTYLGGVIIPNSIASNKDISEATEFSNILSTTFAPSVLIGVADKPNTFASGNSSRSF